MLRKQPRKLFYKSNLLESQKEFTQNESRKIPEPFTSLIEAGQGSASLISLPKGQHLNILTIKAAPAGAENIKGDKITFIPLQQGRGRSCWEGLGRRRPPLGVWLWSCSVSLWS